MRIALASIVLLGLLGAAGRHTVDIKQMQFNPGSLTINKGDVVTWRNSDDRDHTVTAGDGSFDSGKLSPGDSFSQTFKSSGNFSYGCSYHPRMKGQVAVRE
jgi:plastocyanin